MSPAECPPWGWHPRRARKRVSETQKNGLNVLGTAQLVDGKFSIQGDLNEVQPVYFFVLNGKSKSGHLMGSIKGASFILEPGNLSMTMDAYGSHVVRGKYNDIVFNSWKQSPEYLAAMAKRRTIWKAVPSETESEKSAREKEGMENEGHHPQPRNKCTQRDCPITPKLAGSRIDDQVHMAFGTPGAYKAPTTSWNKPQTILGPKPMWSNKRAALAKRQAFNEIGKVGSTIKDFETETLDGQPVSLKNIRKLNQYVLLEFWASWCGPCRAEIPPMKKSLL